MLVLPLLRTAWLAISGLRANRGGYSPWRKDVAVFRRMPWSGALAYICEDKYLNSEMLKMRWGDWDER